MLRVPKHWMAALVHLFACQEPPSEPVREALATSEREVLFAKDSELESLADDVSGWPIDLPTFEKRFRIGRRCLGITSKEIYVTEERSSRFGGHQQRTQALLPRVAITGCSLVRTAHSLMVAQVSPSHATGTDPIALSPVEVMSFDPQRKSYDFYELFQREGKPTLVRIQRTADGRVVEHEKRLGEPVVTRTSEGPRCFGCHVHGEPMLPELANPWFGWVSGMKRRSERQDYTGASAELAGEAELGSTLRSSLASQLQETVRSALDLMAEGNAYATAGRERTAAAKGLLCPTTLNFGTFGHAYPSALFLDPQLLRYLKTGLLPVIAGNAGAVQVPVRSRFDEVLEDYFVRSGFLRRELALALRAFDDEHDLSDARCALWDRLPGGWADADDRNELLSALLLQVVPADGSLRSTFLRGLASGTAVDANDYTADLLARGAARGATLDRWLPAEIARRHETASSLFSGSESPVPMP